MNIFDLFPGQSWVYNALAIVLLFVMFAIAGVLIVRKLFARQYLESHHEVAGYVFANLGVLYAVLLAFTVVNVQQRFDKINEITQVEAGYLIELYRDAEVFKAEDRARVRTNIKNYALSVLEDEWDIMSLGVTSIQTVEVLKQLWFSYYDIELQSKKQEIWYAVSIDKLNNLVNSRLARLIGSRESLGTEMWALLIIGGLTLITFFWFFGLESRTPHLLMASILAATIAFLLFLIYSLDTAFTGSIKVLPEAIEKVLQGFNEPTK